LSVVHISEFLVSTALI